MQTSPSAGFHPPVSDNNIGQQVPLELQWLDSPMVAVGVVDASTPFVSVPLPRGGYVVWTSGPAWVNAGPDGGSLDATVTSANAGSPAALAGAPKSHDGKQWPVAVRTDSRIALKAKAGSIEFRIWEAL